MFATKASSLIVLLTVFGSVVGNPIQILDGEKRDGALLLHDQITANPADRAQSETNKGAAESLIVSTKEPYVIELRELTTPTTLETATSSSTTKCEISLYRPTPYTQGSIKTVWASTRYLTSYQPCGECTLFVYNPFTYKIPIKWETTITYYETPRTRLIDKCEPTRVTKTKTTTIRATTTTTSEGPVYS